MKEKNRVLFLYSFRSHLLKTQRESHENNQRRCPFVPSSGEVMNKAGLCSGVSNAEATFFCQVKRIPARMHPEEEFQSEAERYFFCVNIGGTTTK